MKKWLIGGGIALSLVLSPYIGKGVENATKALLPGLSTEEQIETVADVVDVNKLEAEAKLAEQQVIIDEQNVKLAEQQKEIEAEQARAINNEKNLECVSKKSEYWYCYSKIYLGSFDSFMDNRLNLRGDKEDKKDYITRYTSIWNFCKEIRQQCN